MKTGADFIFVRSGAVELATRKASGIVRGEGWCGNPSVLTADKFGKLKKAGVSQVKRNKATVCALPAIHLPFFVCVTVRAFRQKLLA